MRVVGKGEKRRDNGHDRGTLSADFPLIEPITHRDEAEGAFGATLREVLAAHYRSGMLIAGCQVKTLMARGASGCWFSPEGSSRRNNRTC